MTGALEEHKEFLSRSEVAEIFSVSPNTVTRWAEAGMLPYIRTLGGHRRYQADSVWELARQTARKERNMERVILHIPNMYGDHHVTHVKTLLQQVAGVKDVLASAAFREAVVTFDPTAVAGAEIESRLAADGYPVGSPNGHSNVGLAGDGTPRRGLAFSEAFAPGSADLKLPEWRASGPLPCPGFEYRDVRDAHPADDQAPAGPTSNRD